MSYGAVTPVHLERESLYVSTIPLTEGFHWALIHIDRSGAATCHQWAAATNDAHDASDLHDAEGYVCQSMPHGPLMKAGQQQILAYFRITEYVPVDVSVLRDVCGSIVPKRSSGALRSRATHMNSRMWITRVLSRVLSPQRAAEIESFVTAHSRTYSDAFARAFLFRQPYSTVTLQNTWCGSTCAACRVHPQCQL